MRTNSQVSCALQVCKRGAIIFEIPYILRIDRLRASSSVNFCLVRIVPSLQHIFSAASDVSYNVMILRSRVYYGSLVSF